jgi:hypothetical protein
MFMARHLQSEIKDAHWLEDLETTFFILTQAAVGPELRSYPHTATGFC